MSFVAELKAAMAERNMPGTVLSRRMGMGHNWISNIVSSRRWPSLADAERIALALEAPELVQHWKPAPWATKTGPLLFRRKSGNSASIKDRRRTSVQGQDDRGSSGGNRRRPG
jgi:transcriptional regulator with XRE-family HTH domain